MDRGEAGRVDETDFAIVEHLQRNGRDSIRRLAEAIKIDESATRRRISDLLKREVIRIVAVLNLPSDPSTLVSIVKVRTSNDPVATARRFAEWPEVQWLTLVSGDADILLSIYAGSPHSLLDSLCRMRTAPSVDILNAQLCLDVVKRGYILPPTQRSDGSGTDQADSDPLGSSYAEMRGSPIGEWLYHRVDEIDWVIIQRLRQDGRIPLSTIAAELRASEAMVRKRLKRLTADNLIQVVAIPTSLVSQKAFAGVVSINVRADPRPIAAELASWSDVTWMALMDGEAAIMAEFVATNRASFLELVERAYGLSGVSGVRPCLYLRPIKQTLVGPIPAKSTLELAAN